MKLCLDTNAYSALMQGEKRLVALLENADEIYLPVTVLGELYSGFQLGTLFEKKHSDSGSVSGQAGNLHSGDKQRCGIPVWISCKGIKKDGNSCSNE